MVKLEDFLKKIFYISLAVFPLSIGCGLGISMFITHFNLFGNADTYSHANMYHIPECIAISLAIMAVIFVAQYKELHKKDFAVRYKKYIPLLVLAVAVIVRLVWFLSMEAILEAFSDGKNVWEIANGDWSGVPYRRKVYQNGWNNFTAWAYLCVTFLKFTYPAFILLSEMVDALTALFVCLIARKVLKSDKVALLAGMTYALSPSVIVRNYYFSPDVYALFGLLAGVYLLCFVFESQKPGLKEYAMTLAAGTIIGIANSVKSCALIIAVAMVIVTVMKILRTENAKQKLLSCLLVMVLAVVPAFGVNQLALRASSVVLNTTVSDLNTWHFLNVGLNPYGDGDIGAPHSFDYVGWLESPDYTPEEAKEMLFDFLKEAWAESETEVGPWLWRKIIRAWQDDVVTYNKVGIYSLDWEHATEPGHKFIINFWQQYECSIQQCMYILTMAFAAIGVLITLKKYRKSDSLFIMALYIFGFALLMLLSECQSRYKTNIIPFLYIFSAMGFCGVSDLIENALKRHKN